MRIKSFMVCLAFLMIAVSSSFADVIVLKSGKTVEANILEKTSEKIKVDIEGIGITYFVSDIESINGEKITPGTAAAQTIDNPPENLITPEEGSAENTPETTTTTETPATETVPATQASTVSQENTITSSNEDAPAAITEAPQLSSQEYSAPNLEKTNPANEDEFVPVRQQENVGQPISTRTSTRHANRFSLNEKGSTAAALAAMSTFMGIFFIIGLAAYIFTSLCLQMIAKKTNNEPSWLAWIPIANLFLMCKIAGLSYWWLLIILAGFIPILGFFASLGFSGFLWYKIAIARGKPGWIGVLVLVPLAGIAVMGYLAFTE
ncbi:MAG: hypothetical protein PHV55_04330 [Candidatus Omnitrophica bacterium]|nr:hypothetical protein [Candidatus Omnitrophota bacterium]